MDQQNMNQNQMQGKQVSENMPGMMNHGGHELFDAHEVIGGVIGMLDQYKMYEQHVQDTELKSMMQRHSNFVTNLYNTMLDTFQTGKDPSQPTQTYNMSQSNDVIYGMKPGGQPKKPIQSMNEISDECISSFMMSQAKGLASHMTMAALESTNPVMRRVFADSIPNMIEMAYEIFLYQNKHGYYQVPQLAQNDMTQLMQSFAKAPQNPIN
ncbi:spore coat protein [Alteribacillus iranensis]|uniref:Spore coat protein CotF n=1 Tax=Alteribacillus iranensis TaxID=930128 RepID=A0A1I2AK01_9BACI|nr:spore coat protein [Alteribacillus iranensis]SFE43190.1 Spore coat protein CotF [Alteribacillus iranensis]